MTIFCETVKA